MNGTSGRHWFITGCSSGFGRALAELIGRRGETVTVTGLTRESVADIAENARGKALALALDVRDSAQVGAAVAQAEDTFGPIDVLVNNAGYGIQGPLEDTEEAPLRAIFETNVFGMIAVIKAVLPGMRAAGRGRIINLSSIGGRFSAPMLSIYSATKYAVEGLSAGLADELEPFGIRITAVEPGAFATNFGTSSLVRVDPGQAYAKAVAAMNATLSDMQPDDPRGAALAIADLADLADPPRQLPLGRAAHAMVTQGVAAQASELERWRDLSASASLPIA